MSTFPFAPFKPLLGAKNRNFRSRDTKNYAFLHPPKNFPIANLRKTKRDIGKTKRDIGETKRAIVSTERGLVFSERGLVFSERGLVFSERAKK